MGSTLHRPQPADRGMIGQVLTSRFLLAALFGCRFPFLRCGRSSGQWKTRTGHTRPTAPRPEEGAQQRAGRRINRTRTWRHQPLAAVASPEPGPPRQARLSTIDAFCWRLPRWQFRPDCRLSDSHVGGYPLGSHPLDDLSPPFPVAVMGGETHCTGTRRPEVTRLQIDDRRAYKLTTSQRQVNAYKSFGTRRCTFLRINAGDHENHITARSIPGLRQQVRGSYLRGVAR